MSTHGYHRHAHHEWSQVSRSTSFPSGATFECNTSQRRAAKILVSTKQIKPTLPAMLLLYLDQSQKCWCFGLSGLFFFRCTNDGPSIAKPQDPKQGGCSPDIGKMLKWWWMPTISHTSNMPFLFRDQSITTPNTMMQIADLETRYAIPLLHFSFNSTLCCILRSFIHFWQSWPSPWCQTTEGVSIGGVNIQC